VGPLALEAAGGLQARHLLAEGKGDFIPVVNALAGVLFGKRLRGELEPLLVIQSRRGCRSLFRHGGLFPLIKDFFHKNTLPQGSA
jgi:hypothetical protein